MRYRYYTLFVKKWNIMQGIHYVTECIPYSIPNKLHTKNITRQGIPLSTTTLMYNMPGAQVQDSPAPSINNTETIQART